MDKLCISQGWSFFLARRPLAQLIMMPIKEMMKTLNTAPAQHQLVVTENHR